MVQRVVCQESGKIATADCTNIRTDCFTSGTQPYSFCSSHNLLEPEDKIDDAIENTDQALNDVAPGSGASNPPAEGESVAPSGGTDTTQAPENPPAGTNQTPVTDDESQEYWNSQE